MQNNKTTGSIAFFSQPSITINIFRFSNLKETNLNYFTHKGFSPFILANFRLVEIGSVVLDEEIIEKYVFLLYFYD